MKTLANKLHETLANDRFAAHNDIRLVSVIAGESVAEMTVSENHLNGIGILQGGALFTLADFAFAAAANSRGRIAVATFADITFFKGISSGKVIAKASELNVGKTLSTYVVEITDEAGSKIAHFTGTAFLKQAY